MTTVESFDTLVTLSIDDLVKRSKAYFSTVTRLGKLKEEETNSRRQAGKVVAAFKRVYAEKQDAGEFPAGTSFAEYFQNVTGAKPEGRVEQCANCFNHLVVSKLIAENDYDKSATDWLEKASVIVKQSGNALTHPNVLKTAELLKERPHDTAKQLRQLKAKAKGQDSKVDDEGKPFTLETVIAFVKIAVDKGYAADVFRTMTDLIGSEGKEWNPETQQAVYLESRRANGDVWEKVTAAETLDAWITGETAKDEPVKIVAVPDFQAHAAKLYPSAKGRAVTKCVSMLQKYYGKHNALPDKAAFEAYGNKLVAQAA